ncbi:MAG: ISL3 family transposase [Anaerovoracaceae bacterium]|jgi:transposase
MLYTDYTENLLGLKDTIVTKVENIHEEVHIFIDMKLEAQACPHCKHETKRIHDYRTQIAKDLSKFGSPVFLHLRKRRYYCPYCNKSFNQKISFLPRYQRITTRTQAYIMDEFRKVYSIKSVVERHKVSQAVATRLLDLISFPRPSLPEVIAIDKFKGNAGHKFQCILTDPKKKKVLDILESRKSEDQYDYFMKIDKHKRNNVKYVVMDMSNLFRQAAHTLFPNAQVVADKFHVCRQVTWALERVRKEEQKKFGKERRIYFKKSRWILLKRYQSLTDEERLQLEGMLQISPKIRDSSMLKEKFYYFMDSKNIYEAKTRLKEWFMQVGCVDIPGFKACVDTFSRWDKEILAAFDCGFSNGFTEGTNNKIKVIKRISYGVRNFNRFRNPILHATAY